MNFWFRRVAVAVFACCAVGCGIQDGLDAVPDPARSMASPKGDGPGAYCYEPYCRVYQDPGPAYVIVRQRNTAYARCAKVDVPHPRSWGSVADRVADCEENAENTVEQWARNKGGPFTLTKCQLKEPRVRAVDRACQQEYSGGSEDVRYYETYSLLEGVDCFRPENPHYHIKGLLSGIGGWIRKLFGDSNEKRREANERACEASREQQEVEAGYRCTLFSVGSYPRCERVEAEEPESPPESASARELAERELADFFPGIPLPEEVKNELLDLRVGGGCYAVREAVSDETFDDFVVLKFPEGIEWTPPEGTRWTLSDSIPYEVALLVDLQTPPPRRVGEAVSVEGVLVWFPPEDGEDHGLFYGEADFNRVWSNENVRIGFGVFPDNNHVIMGFSDLLWSAECAASEDPYCEDRFIHTCGAGPGTTDSTRRL